jgi:hypothetical protein
VSLGPAPRGYPGRLAQAELAGAGRRGLPALRGEHPFGHGDLLGPARLVRPARSAEGTPSGRSELQAASETIAGIDGPVAAALTLSDLVPNACGGGVGSTGERNRGTQRDRPSHGHPQQVPFLGRSRASGSGIQDYFSLIGEHPAARTGSGTERARGYISIK